MEIAKNRIMRSEKGHSDFSKQCFWEKGKNVRIRINKGFERIQ